MILCIQNILCYNFKVVGLKRSVKFDIIFIHRSDEETTCNQTVESKVINKQTFNEVNQLSYNTTTLLIMNRTISENRKKYATLNDRPGSLRAKPGWFSDLITPYEGFAEGPPRPLGNIVKASA